MANPSSLTLDAQDQTISMAASTTASGGVRVSLSSPAAPEGLQYETDFRQAVELRDFLNKHIDGMAAGFAPGAVVDTEQQDPSLDNRWQDTRVE